MALLFAVEIATIQFLYQSFSKRVDSISLLDAGQVLLRARVVLLRRTWSNETFDEVIRLWSEWEKSHWSSPSYSKVILLHIPWFVNFVRSMHRPRVVASVALNLTSAWTAACFS
jgi:hypothetical protein